MPEVKWIKLSVDMFDNKKIKYLRTLPEGDGIVLIWVMLLTMAGRCNAGGMIFLTEKIPYTTKMIADELGFDENTVVLALEALERCDMISRSGDYIEIPGWEDHQNAEALEKIQEQNRIRKKKQREKQKLIKSASQDMSRGCHGGVTGQSRDKSVTVTGQKCDSHATDIDIEKDKDIDISSSPLDISKIENGRNVDNVDNFGGGGGKTQKNQKSFTDLMGAIKQQIEYDCLICDYEKGQVDLAVQCIAELYTAESGIKINGATYPQDMCMERAGQIDDQHTRYALDMAEKAEGVHNVKAYLKAVLFNAPVTMDMYYKNLLSNDDKLR